MLQTAARPEFVVPLVLRADIAAQIDELENKLLELRHEELDTLAGDPRAKQIADEIAALIEESKDSTIKIKFRGLRRKQWSDLLAKYPPTDPTKFRYDPKIFEAAVPECWVEPDIDDDTRDKLLEELTDGQWDTSARRSSTSMGRGCPFLRARYAARRSSAESEQQPEPTE
jgi:hypothetical protein